MRRRKPTRRDLLVVVGRLQDLVGAARGCHHDRNQNREADVNGLLDLAHALCIEALAQDPPQRPSGPWADTTGEADRRFI